MKWVNYSLYPAIGTVILDQVTKYLIRSEIPLHTSIPITPFLSIAHINNTGVTFGFFQGASLFWTLIVILIIGGIIFNYKTLVTSKATAIAIGAILGGATGNLIDRILFGAVTDFISVGWWPAFNVADTAISGSAVFLAYYWWKE